jgi:hypothetical protein
MDDKEVCPNNGARSGSVSSTRDVKVLRDGVDAITSDGEHHRMSASMAIDPAAERRLIDLRILPSKCCSVP